jgi:hypothetical protein
MTPLRKKIILILVITTIVLAVLYGLYVRDFTTTVGCDCLLHIDSVKIERENSSSILITPIIDESNYISAEPRPHYRVLVDGRDVSSLAMIRQQGLSDSLYPTKGLVYSNESCERHPGSNFCYGTPVAFNGRDFANLTGPRSVSVELIYPADSQMLAEIAV